MPKNKPNVFDGQNITPSEFFKTHWQRIPYLFTNTSIDLSCLPSIEQLFSLAAEDHVQSRIIYTNDHIRYQAIYDEPGAWDEVKAYQPTLLVSDIEKWFTPAIKLMSWFPFIKNWRFDDLMMSFAPKGASVGAHTDHYDVFLVQVQGTRQWSFDDEPLSDEYEMVEDSELSVIADFEAKHTVELKAGDVLYLPPEIPHHGISTSDDCVTCSIGLRAPSDSELLTDVIEQIAHDMPAGNRFKDAVMEMHSDASIGLHEIQYLRQQLEKASQLDDTKLATLFGHSLTRYRLFDDNGAECLNINTNDHLLWIKSPFSVFAYYAKSNEKATLFIDGESLSMSLSAAEFICNNQSFKWSTLEEMGLEKDIWHELIELQSIIPSSIINSDQYQ